MATIRRLAWLGLVLGLVVLTGAVRTTGTTHRAVAQGVQVPTTVTIDTTDFTFVANVTTVQAGTVHFVLINDSPDYPHEVWVYPQSQPQLQALLQQKDSGNDVDENDYLQGILGEVTDVPPGGTDNFDAVLTPGVYELGCFVESTVNGTPKNHYELGMHALITAQ